jgi:hypothetical protein
MQRSADSRNSNKRAGTDSVRSLMPVQGDIGLFFLLAIQPKFALAVFSGAGCNTVLDVLESIVEGDLDSLKLFVFFPLERRKSLRQFLEEFQFVDDRAGRRHRLQQIRDHSEKLGAVSWITPGDTGDCSRA